jgi:hypothetical protein
MFHDLVAAQPTQRWRILAIYAAIACAAIVVREIEPTGSMLYPQCPLHALTGLNCPGCGGLRAVHQALHGHLGAAFRLNPLLFVLLPLAVYPVASDLSVVLRGQPLPRLRLFRGWWMVLVGVIFAFGILRNIPLYPFTLLGP